jgi:hypothetical protein
MASQLFVSRDHAEGVQSDGRDFIVRVPARFLKDPRISSEAKALRVVIGAFADRRTGQSYVTGATLEKTLGWGRRRREKAQKELVKSVWLKLGWKRGLHGRWARRIYQLCEPTTVARFERSGETAQLISYHSQVR